MRSFHKSLTNLRDSMLGRLISDEVNNAADTFEDQSLSAQLRQGRWKSANVAAACDALLIGAPLPLAQVRKPGSPAAAAQDPRPALPEADQSLIDAACQAAKAARKQREQAVELPTHDVQEETRHLQQGVQRVLTQMALSADTTVDVLERFHCLAKTLGTTPLEDQPALVREHADAMEQRAADLRKALDTHTAPKAKKYKNETLCDLMEDSQNRLSTDLRLTLRTRVSLRTLEQLLKTRVSARRLHGELEQNRLPDPAGSPELNGQAHNDIRQALEEGMRSVERQMPKGPSKFEFLSLAGKSEMTEHADAAAAMRDKIDSERVLIQGQLLLAQDAKASSQGSAQGSGHPGRPDHLLAHREKVDKLFESLTKINKTLKASAVSSEHADRYKEQHTVYEEVRRGLLVLKMNLPPLDSPPPGTVAVSSSQADEPAAGPSGTPPAAAEAPQGDKSSRRRRQAKRK
jgi:hypothetical protein